MIAVVIGLLIGMGLPAQTSINARLRRSVGSPFVASLVSFASGTVYLALVTMAVGGSFGLPAGIIDAQPWWIWTGGLLGVAFLTGNVLLLPVLGAVETVVIPVFGQIVTGLVIDALGGFAGRTIPLSVPRVAGAVLVAAGLIAAVMLRAGSAAPARVEERTVLVWVARVAGVVTGSLSACQTAINGRLGLVLGSAVESALISFTVGTVALALIVAATRAPLRITRPDTSPNPWWMWAGGVIGGTFVLGNVHLAGQLGTGVTVILILTGSIVGGLLLDRFGWLGTTPRPVRAIQVAGVAVMLVGAWLARLS